MSTAEKIEPEETSDVVVLMNMTKGPLHAPYGMPPPSKTKKTDVLQRQTFATPTKNLTIWPGLNLPVERAVWDEILKNEVVRRWTQPRGRRGRMVEEVPGPPTDVEGRHLDLVLELSASVDAMEWWRAAEERPEVQKALDEKILEMRRLVVEDPDAKDNDF